MDVWYFYVHFQGKENMQRIEYRGEVLPGYAPGLPIKPIGRCEMQRSFYFRR